MTTRPTSSTHAGKAFADPIVPLRPGNPPRQPARHLRFADRCMLLREDAAERPADSSCQFAISLAALEEAPGIATAGNHLADLEAGLRQKRVRGTRNEQRSASKRSAQRSTASRRLPGSGSPQSELRRRITPIDLECPCRRSRRQKVDTGCGPAGSSIGAGGCAQSLPAAGTARCFPLARYGVLR